jgi:phospholipid/cholesterol/gamma-HCH transport system substrate-binding protein
MSRSPTRDFIVGLFVLGGLLAIGYLSLSIGGLSYNGPGGLTLFAKFDETGGLKTRAPVVISGVKVGQVRGIKLTDDFRARVEIEVDKRLALPLDTSASIVTAGLLGDRYITLEVGGDEKLLAPGDEIGFTESAVILERLIGKFIHNAGVQKPASGDGGDNP